MSPLAWKIQFPDFSYSVCDISLEAPAFIPDVIQHYHRVSPEDNLRKTKLELSSNCWVDPHGKKRSLKLRPRNAGALDGRISKFPSNKGALSETVQILQAQIRNSSITRFWGVTEVLQLKCDSIMF